MDQTPRRWPMKAPGSRPIAVSPGCLSRREGDTNPDAAWCYPWTLPWARRVKDRIAFWGGVQIEQAEP